MTDIYNYRAHDMEDEGEDVYVPWYEHVLALFSPLSQKTQRAREGLWAGAVLVAGLGLILLLVFVAVNLASTKSESPTSGVGGVSLEQVAVEVPR